MQQLHLLIPEPCHEDWKKMSPNEQGRFCNSCAKTVIDFASMTDTQLLNFFKENKNANVCGRVNNHQLHRPIDSIPSPRKKLFRYWQYAFAFFMMVGKVQSGKAQGGLVVKTTSAELPKTSSKNTFRIISENGEILAGAEVYFHKQNSRRFADSTGKLSSDQLLFEENITVFAKGFEPKIIAVKDIENNTITLHTKSITLDEVVVTTFGPSTGRMVVAGGISYGYTVITNRFADTINTIKNYFNPSFSVYPNPVAGGSPVNLSFKLNSVARHQIMIVDAAGKLMLAQQYVPSAKNSILPISIPSQWSKGIYFVVLVDEKGKKVGREKVRVL